MARILRADGQGTGEAERTVAGSRKAETVVGTAGLRVETHLDLLAIQVREANTPALVPPLCEIHITRWESNMLTPPRLTIGVVNSAS